MIRFLGIYIFMLSLLPNFGGHEFLKLPVLLIHYYEHTEQSENPDWSRFLEEHYGNSEHSESDSHHDKLPFKEHQCQLIQVVSIPHELPVFNFQNTIPEPDFNLTVQEMQSQYQIHFWQPPKLA